MYFGEDVLLERSNRALMCRCEIGARGYEGAKKKKEATGLSDSQKATDSLTFLYKVNNESDLVK